MSNISSMIQAVHRLRRARDKAQEEYRRALIEAYHNRGDMSVRELAVRLEVHYVHLHRLVREERESPDDARR